jgi:hypothetical protein
MMVLLVLGELDYTFWVSAAKVFLRLFGCFFTWELKERGSLGV